MINEKTYWLKMKMYQHCQLCENENTHLIDGLTCKLTGSKPAFLNTCSDIHFGNKFIEKLESIIIDLEILKKRKTSVHIKFYISIVIGFTMLFLADQLSKLNNESVYFYYFLISLISGGVSLWIVGFDSLYKYKRELKNILNYQHELDRILRLYEIDYASNLVFSKSIHGTREVAIELKFNKNLVEDSKTVYKLNH